ncbi:MAG TPA: class I adenylate-forming enzyme family protein [Chthonomonadaceae bacterium]|nr:class I adenylate-forming enzyme family protein [Chthonomonadaceae bacterium]
MMIAEQTENVFPDTISNIHHARSLSDRPWEERMTPYANIGALLTMRAAETPDKNFLTYYDTGGFAAAYTYAEFAEAARRVAAFMTNALGMRPGDRVATLMVNDARTVLIYFAAWLLGATVVPINCTEDDERVGFILDNSEAKAAFVLSDQIERCELLRGQRQGIVHYIQVGGPERAGYLDFTQALENTPPLDPLPDLSPDTECLIVYTSGTTGAPKGVVLVQANLLADADSIAAWHRFGPEDRAMCVLPIHHVNGTVVTLMTPLYSGGSVVLNRSFRAHSFWRTLAAERCTWVSVVPTILAFLCEAREDLSALDLSRFRHIICGAGPLTVELAKRFDETFGVRVVHGYGLSETTCYSCFLPIDLDRKAFEHWMFECGFPSIGCPISANEMAIHDSEGHPLPPDTRGEIVARGHNVMKYYFKRPDANRDTFAHGWFRSGDEGFYRQGEDGRAYFFITGRIKELIIRGGVNYSPFDIDEVLNAIPGVKAAMAVGFENDFYGEEVGAYVQLEEGAQVTEEEIIAACRQRLPFAKSPKVVLFGDTFPVTSTGKYQRNKLKPLFAEWQSVQFKKAT